MYTYSLIFRHLLVNLNTNVFEISVSSCQSMNSLCVYNMFGSHACWIVPIGRTFLSPNPNLNHHCDTGLCIRVYDRTQYTKICNTAVFVDISKQNRLRFILLTKTTAVSIQTHAPIYLWGVYSDDFVFAVGVG